MMLRGPMGERATVGWFDGLLFCAWTDSREDVIELVCGMREDRNTRSIIPSVLVPMLREVLSRRRRLLLHAAAVYCPNAVGIQLVAPSCGGKTTTSMSLVRRGALLVADDLLVLDSSCEHPKVFGIPKLLNLRRPTMEIFQELCQYSEVEHRLRGKASVHPQALFGPGCTTASCPVHVIYFLNLTAGPPSAYPLETEEALKRLILCHTFAYEQEIAAASVIMLCELLSCARTYQLNTGENADGLGGWLLDNCAEHATPHFVGSPEDKTGDE